MAGGGAGPLFTGSLWDMVSAIFRIIIMGKRLASTRTRSLAGKCFLDQSLLLSTGLSAHHAGIPQRHDGGQSGERKASQPVNDKINPLESRLKQRESRNQHPHRHRQEDIAKPASNWIPWTSHTNYQ